LIEMLGELLFATMMMGEEADWGLLQPLPSAARWP
jgi:hypothetical protein